MSSQTSQSVNRYVQSLPQVKRYLNDLEQQNLWWTTVAMVGKINNENIDPQLLVSIVQTQSEFQHLRDMMIDSLIQSYMNQANTEVALKAQAIVDILNRNLFERTADVGFLATDLDLLEYVKKPSAERLAFVHERLKEYVAKYSVYDDIALIQPDGKVLVTLNAKTEGAYVQDPLIQQALSGQQDFVEVHRFSKIFPDAKQSLIYAKRMVCPKTSSVLAVLCLRFRFKQEMSLIFERINHHQSDYHLVLMDEAGLVIASDTTVHQEGQRLSRPVLQMKPSSEKGQLCFYAKAKGYEGYKGLPWYSYIHINHQDAFKDQVSHLTNIEIKPSSPLYLAELEETNLKVSTLLLIVILNGKITSLKRDVKSFLPILESFQGISANISTIFNDFIHHIHKVVAGTIQQKVHYSAQLAMDIMDRNLYERANDCRWWALTSQFRQLMTIHQTSPLDKKQKQAMQQTLTYINRLYTVYTNILIFDTHGVVLAVSNPRDSDRVGQRLSQNISATLQLSSTQAYHVSAFEPTELYDNKPTYIYYAAIKDWKSSVKNVGGMALVFDSEPQFQAMLEDTRPQFNNAKLQSASFSLFVEPNGKVLSSTHPDLKVMSRIAVPPEFNNLMMGDSGSTVWQILGQDYLMGYQMTQGYREFKRMDGYQNPVLALTLAPI